MPVELSEWIQRKWESTPEHAEVQRVAHKLQAHLNEPDAQTLIADANKPGNSSALVQATFLHFARDIGFVDESKGLSASYMTSALRPDYFLQLSTTGIILEVERGKTTINNMDLLDFWKCHLCEHANYLFLMVPNALRQNITMSPRNEYAFVVKRLEAFFRPRNYTNVRGLFVFGY